MVDCPEHNTFESVLEIQLENIIFETTVQLGNPQSIWLLALVAGDSRSYGRKGNISKQWWQPKGRNKDNEKTLELEDR